MGQKTRLVRKGLRAILQSLGPPEFCHQSPGGDVTVYHCCALNVYGGTRYIIIVFITCISPWYTSTEYAVYHSVYWSQHHDTVYIIVTLWQ